jgi:uncharacterized protein DUF5999
MCTHSPTCPDLESDDRCRAQVIADHSGDQGWSRLCNGVIRFDDGRYLTPDGVDQTIALAG